MDKILFIFLFYGRQRAFQKLIFVKADNRENAWDMLAEKLHKPLEILKGCVEAAVEICPVKDCSRTA